VNLLRRLCCPSWPPAIGWKTFGTCALLRISRAICVARRPGRHNCFYIFHQTPRLRFLPFSAPVTAITRRPFCFLLLPRAKLGTAKGVWGGGRKCWFCFVDSCASCLTNPPKRAGLPCLLVVPPLLPPLPPSLAPVIIKKDSHTRIKTLALAFGQRPAATDGRCMTVTPERTRAHCFRGSGSYRCV
jgi:hypothetical protein